MAEIKKKKPGNKSRTLARQSAEEAIQAGRCGGSRGGRDPPREHKVDDA